MSHRHYHRIFAKSPAELGHKLGLRFGSIVRDYVEKARENDGWNDKVACALMLLEPTQRHFPQYIEEISGYAEAAHIPMRELWALCVEDDAHNKCTTVVTNGGKLLLHNEDWDPEAANAVCVLEKTVGELTILELYYYGIPLGGSAVSINSNGTIQAINSLDHSDREVGVPKVVIARWLSESRDIVASLELIRGISRASGYNHVLVSRDGQLFDVECSATEMAVLQPSAPYVHTNHFLSDELKSLNATALTISSARRYEAARRSTKAAMSVEDLISVSDDKSGGREYGIMNRNTIGKMVVDFDAGTARIWLRREAQAGWVVYPLGFLKGT